jgi:hypothetical protein
VIELAVPERGPLTLLVYGAGTVRQNITGYAIMDHAKRLKFSVGDTTYEVLTPDHDLTSDERTAWLGFAKWKGFPVYSADGPLAVDP